MVERALLCFDDTGKPGRLDKDVEFKFDSTRDI